GVIGVPNVVIETSGSTSLVQTGNVYQLNPVGGGTGPTAKYLGSSITVGQFGGWAPIGAEATASGYQVAWKLAGADQYTVWSTDTNGNDTVKLLDSVSGGSAALQSIETSFAQDLNGDGVIGVPPSQSVANIPLTSNIAPPSVRIDIGNDSFMFSVGILPTAANNVEVEFGSKPSTGDLSAPLLQEQTFASGMPQQAENHAQDVLGGHDQPVSMLSHVVDWHLPAHLLL
ncbi:hypothetical protein HCN58_29030, partial [Bradyrhizobium sp. WSM 1791]|nr:hypothetical protein [Bradyrhizobium australiense]